MSVCLHVTVCESGCPSVRVNIHRGQEWSVPCGGVMTRPMSTLGVLNAPGREAVSAVFEANDLTARNTHTQSRTETHKHADMCVHLCSYTCISDIELCSLSVRGSQEKNSFLPGTAHVAPVGE